MGSRSGVLTVLVGTLVDMETRDLAETASMAEMTTGAVLVHRARLCNGLGS